MRGITQLRSDREVGNRPTSERIDTEAADPEVRDAMESGSRSPGRLKRPAGGPGPACRLRPSRTAAQPRDPPSDPLAGAHVMIPMRAPYPVISQPMVHLCLRVSPRVVGAQGLRPAGAISPRFHRCVRPAFPG